MGIGIWIQFPELYNACKVKAPCAIHDDRCSQWGSACSSVQASYQEHARVRVGASYLCSGIIHAACNGVVPKAKVGAYHVPGAGRNERFVECQCTYVSTIEFTGTLPRTVLPFREAILVSVSVSPRVMPPTTWTTACVVEPDVDCELM